VIARCLTGSAIACRLQKFIDLLDRRAQQFDLTGGILSTFPWIRYIAPEMSGYNILITLNNELKSFLMVRGLDLNVNSILASY